MATEFTSREKDMEGITKLGSENTEYKYAEPSVKMLECFDNPHPEKAFVIQHQFHEFTSLCPKTGQPDFATIVVQFIPDLKCVETKSLKLYYFAYRNHGAFMEAITGKIRNDLVEAMGGVKWLRVTAVFAPRGGIETKVFAETGDSRPYEALLV